MVQQSIDEPDHWRYSGFCAHPMGSTTPSSIILPTRFRNTVRTLRQTTFLNRTIMGTHTIHKIGSNDCSIAGSKRQHSIQNITVVACECWRVHAYLTPQ